jgi:outer membrane protein TolC
MDLKAILVRLMLVSLPLTNSTSIFGQHSLTLRECLNYAKSNNHELKAVGYRVEISRSQVTEQTGNYLPQLVATGTLDDNLQLATQLMPAEMSGGIPGTYTAVTFGTRYNLNGGLELTQKLFDREILMQIKSSKLNTEISQLNRQQTDINVAYDISLSFYKSLVIQMQVNVLKSTLVASDKSLQSAELKYKNGLAKKIEVDKIRVSYNNTKSQLEQAILRYSKSLNTLKFNMGMPVDSTIILAETSISNEYDLFTNNRSKEYQMDNIIEYKLNKSNLSSAMIDKKSKQSAFFPTLSFYGSYNYNAMRQEFDFFNSGKNWYSSSGIGLRLTMHLFDGLKRTSKLTQSELNIKIANENLKISEQSIKVEISNYEIQYNNALDNIVREKENLDLATSVYSSSQQEYQQGTCTLLDLIQSESSFLVAQSNYYNKLLELYMARLDLERAEGTLLEFLNNLK